MYLFLHEQSISTALKSDVPILPQCENASVFSQCDHCHNVRFIHIRTYPKILTWHPRDQIKSPHLNQKFRTDNAELGKPITQWKASGALKCLHAQRCKTKWPMAQVVPLCNWFDRTVDSALFSKATFDMRFQNEVVLALFLMFLDICASDICKRFNKKSRSAFMTCKSVGNNCHFLLAIDMRFEPGIAL